MDPSQVSVRRYLPKILGLDVLLKLEIELALLFFAALLISLDVNLTFAQSEAAQAGSVTSANKVAGRGNAESGSLPAAIAETEEHGLPQKAVEIARPFGFPITNSMVVSWIVAVGLIIFARVATRDMKGVPGGAQNLLEWLVGALYDFLEGIIGPRLVKRTFWFLATIFIFILSDNWVGLIPGAGTIGWGHPTPNGFVVDQPFFRGANADLNLTLAMALVFFACWIIWALQELGPVGFVKELFAPKGESTGLLKSVDDRRVLRRRLVGNHFDSLSTSITEFSSLRQHLCRGKHVGNHVPDGAGFGVALADSVLFPGIAGGPGAGAGLHVVVRRLHSADVSA